MLNDITYVTDSLDFSKILFDDTRKITDSTYKKLVLWTLAFTSSFFCFNLVYRPRKTHVKFIYHKRLNKLEELELRLAYDPFIRYVLPNILYEIPMTIARLVIFYSYRPVGWENFSFLIKNIFSVFLTMTAYFEIKTVKKDEVFFSITTYDDLV